MRAKYPDLAPIGTSELASDYDAYLVVDVRSEEEFESIHMLGASNLPIALESLFLPSLDDLAGRRDRPIVVYCNGVKQLTFADTVRLYAACDLPLVPGPYEDARLRESPSDTRTVPTMEVLHAFRASAPAPVTRARARSPSARRAGNAVSGDGW